MIIDWPSLLLGCAIGGFVVNMFHFLGSEGFFEPLGWEWPYIGKRPKWEDPRKPEPPKE